jgi:hypothetical protein
MPDCVLKEEAVCQECGSKTVEGEKCPEPDCPVNNVSWYDAVAYCNWLSEQEGIPKEQWCYQVNEKGDYYHAWNENPAGLSAADWVSSADRKRMGVRLPSANQHEFLVW